MSDFIAAYPHFRNQHTLTQDLGLALNGSQVYYASTAGPGTACKGIWGSLVGNRAQLDCPPWSYSVSGVKGLKTAYQSLPNSNFQHMVSLFQQPTLLVAANPVAAQLYDDLDLDIQAQRQALLEAEMPTIQRRFVAYLNAHTDVPVLPSWAVALWQEALQSGGMIALESYGDCLGAWLIQENFDWLKLVQVLLARGQIAIKQEEL